MTPQPSSEPLSPSQTPSYQPETPEKAKREKVTAAERRGRILSEMRNGMDDLYQGTQGEPYGELIRRSMELNWGTGAHVKSHYPGDRSDSFPTRRKS